MNENNHKKLARKLIEIRKRDDLRKLVYSKCDVSLCYNPENSFSMLNQHISVNCC
ncbi:MAG: hypothetical protein ACFFFT_09240 [Candidatus Thorarchaeota archaeon]